MTAGAGGAALAVTERAKRDVRIISGLSSCTKVIEVDGIDASQVHGLI